MKLKASPYWAAAAAALAGAACLAEGLTATGTCHIQDIGPMICTAPGANWTWAGDALLAVAVTVAAVTVLVRRHARRGA